MIWTRSESADGNCFEGSVSTSMTLFSFFSGDQSSATMRPAS
jgi:hypothetical protein